jgi:hypothetical protein
MNAGRWNMDSEVAALPRLGMTGYDYGIMIPHVKTPGFPMLFA